MAKNQVPSDEIRDETSNESSDETSDQSSDETNNETSNETSDDKARDQTRDKSSDETNNETSNETSDDKARDETNMNEWLSSIDMLLTSVDLNYIQSCSISIVPEELINSSNKADYMPKVVSIGPKFKGSKEDLHLMEEVKLRSMLYLLHRAKDAPEYLQKCGKAIWKSDEQVRASYVSDIKLEKKELARIMLIDGCFLLELVIAKGFDSKLPSRWRPPSPAFKVLKDDDVMSDLMLLENQIPILVLHRLSQILFPNEFPELKDMEDIKDRAEKINNLILLKDRAEKINNLILSIIGYAQPEVQNPSYFKAPHILDIVHFFVNRKGETKSDRVGDYVLPIIGTQHPKTKLKRCASRLQAAGVTIQLAGEKHSGNSCFSFLRNCFGGICIRLGNMLVTTNTQVDASEEVKGLDFYFNFEKGKLEIARLEITKTTKAKWRNIIAWEHHKNNWKCFENTSAAESGSNDYNQVNTSSLSRNFTSSALIFDGLVCCAADVKLLKDKNIIVDHLKMSDEELEEFFHSMSFGVDLGIVDSSYVKIVDDLNNYSRAFFILRILKIFSHLFKGRLEWLFKFLKQNYNFVAAMLAFLTLVQTVYTVLSYHLPK